MLDSSKEFGAMSEEADNEALVTIEVLQHCTSKLGARQPSHDWCERFH
jgi:hypothetical protein